MDLNGDERSSDCSTRHNKSTASCWKRERCASCQGNFKFFCPKCCVPLGVPPDVTVPRLRLPLTVDIWFHDHARKSTATHAKTLAPEDVNLVQCRASELSKQGATPLPEYDPNTTFVVYPTDTASKLPEMTKDELEKLEKVVFIDSPWQKAPALLQYTTLSNLKCIKLADPPMESKFWRYHKAGGGCVSTIEAIQLLLEEYKQAASAAGIPLRPGVDESDLSDLLYLFGLLREVIEETYEKDPQLCIQPPTDPAEKERRQQLREQKEAGKKRKIENREKLWKKMKEAKEKGENLPKKGKCFNCRKPGHEAWQCPQPCRFCQSPDHYTGTCPQRGKRANQPQEPQGPVTKAI